MTHPDISTEIALLMSSIQDKLHPRAHEIVDGFLKVGERRVAIEHLCELLCEDEILLDSSAHLRLSSIASLLNLNPRFIAIVPKA